MALTKLKKAKTAEPLYTDHQLEQMLAAFSPAIRGSAKKAAIAVRENYEKRRASGSIIAHPKSLSYTVNLADNLVIHDCCGTRWDASRWMTSFVPKNWKPGSPFLLNFCPVCGAATKPAEAADPIAKRIEDLSVAENGRTTMRVEKTPE